MSGSDTNLISRSPGISRLMIDDVWIHLAVSSNPGVNVEVISLNIWGGHVKQRLLDFVKSHRHVDVFCLQEVYHDAPHKITDEERDLALDIFAELEAILPDHQGYFKPVVDDIYGIGMLVKNTVDIIQEGDVIIHDNPDYCGVGPTHSRNLQWIKGIYNDSEYLIANVHGLWNGQGKSDSPARIEQSQRINALINTFECPKIVCGDFNLRPDTKSIALIEDHLENLITRYQIVSTRTSYYPKQERHADYMFVSPELDVSDFKVLDDEVSDHAPLYLAL